MKQKALLTFILTITCLFAAAFPAFAGEWVAAGEDQWQYIEDDGEVVIGWLDLDNDRYYLDEDGCRVNGRWTKISRYWYYFDEDGILARDTWVDNYHVDTEGRKDKAR